MDQTFFYNVCIALHYARENSTLYKVVLFRQINFWHLRAIVREAKCKVEYFVLFITMYIYRTVCDYVHLPFFNLLSPFFVQDPMKIFISNASVDGESMVIKVKYANCASTKMSTNHL